MDTKKLEEIQKEKQNADPATDLITNKASEDAYFDSLVVTMEQYKKELMKPVAIKKFIDSDISYLNKE